ncbi:MAG: anthranilate synthase component I family protein [Bacteroidota bacterium]
MRRISKNFKVEHPYRFKRALMYWGHRSEYSVWLDSNGHVDAYSNFEATLAIAEQTGRSEFTLHSLDKVQDFIDKEPDWLFGFISYDVKNQLEPLVSEHPDHIGFPLIGFFIPDKIIQMKGNNVTFLYRKAVQGDIQADFDRLNTFVPQETKDSSAEMARIRMRIHKEAYFKKVNALLEHIHKGDIYEANFCQEFYAENTPLNPVQTFERLNTISKAPFSALLRWKKKHLLCASPERYLKRTEQTVWSQPIKGTAPRGSNVSEDKEIAKALKQDPKERSENIMITDLVRNDLSKGALRGSVSVEELCEVYSFEQVHQMISTVKAEVADTKKSTDLIRDTFPMGSMTGAPKISAMKLIEKHEETKRGLYSGTVGYFAPNGDFDFNVVIRSILYNAETQYISFSVGSAITAKSKPEKEYQECLLKAKAMRKVLESKNP